MANLNIRNLQRGHMEEILGLTAEEAVGLTYNDLVYRYTQYKNIVPTSSREEGLSPSDISDIILAEVEKLPVASELHVDSTTTTAEVNSWLAGSSAFGVHRLSGELTLTDTLVIHSDTYLDATGSVIVQSNSGRRLVQNSAFGGSGARNSNIKITGGAWDRSVGGSGTDGNQSHSIVLHRADNVTISDLTFHGEGAIKYAVYGCDVNSFRVERLDITSTSDGVHITGPASDITIRDISGDTEDDLVSFTGRDYVTYEITAGGGDLSGITVEQINHRSGDGNAVKLLPGLGKTLTNAKVRNVSGNPGNSHVIIFSDEVMSSTTGGTVKDVLIDGVSGNPGTGFMVNCAHSNIENVTIRNIAISKANLTRAIAFSKGITKQAIIDGVTSAVEFVGNAVHIATGHTVETLKISNVDVQCGTGLGWVVAVSGAIGHLQLSNITQRGGRALVDLSGAASCPLISVNGYNSTATTIGLFNNSAGCSVEFQASNVTSLPNRFASANAAGSHIFMRGSNIVATEGGYSLIARNAETGATIRATGVGVKVDVSTLTPQQGDTVYNTANTASTPVGVLSHDATGRWRASDGTVSSFTRGMDFPSIAAGGQESMTFAAAIYGATVGDVVTVIPPATLEAGLSWTAWVSSPGNITLRLTNHTSSAINPANATWGFRVS